MHVAYRAVALLLALVVATGCQAVRAPSPGRSPLLPLVASPDVVTLEIFSAPVTMDDPRLAEVWGAVDEQPLSPELRQKLAINGVRAGVVNAHVPDCLAELLKVTDVRLSAEERTMVPMETEPGVILRVMQPIPGKRHELIVSREHDQVSLLRSHDGELDGRTYRQAEGRLLLRCDSEADGRVRLELVPELQHGDLRTQTTGHDGVFIWKPERQRQTFSELKMEVKLAAGEMFVIGCLANRPQSVGHCFFTEQGTEKPTQRLWVVRVAQASPDRAFADFVAATTDEPLANEAR
jgi:hypothetical protein